jgi:hypothetical protein
MAGRPTATHCDAGTLELLADRAPMNPQLGTNLAQSGPVIQVGGTLNVHGATVASLGPDRFSTESGCSARQGTERAAICIAAKGAA